jgi:hypothetical protein
MPINERPSPQAILAIEQAVLAHDGGQAQWSNYSILEEVFDPGEQLPIPRQTVIVQRKTVFVFADDAPRFNFAHPCRYLLYDAVTWHLYQVVPARFPPLLARGDQRQRYRTFHRPVRHLRQLLFPLPSPPIWRPLTSGRRYALLFSGMTFNRHFNDLEFLYRTLINVYNYAPGDITVLNYDGTRTYDELDGMLGSWPGNNTSYQVQVDGAGTKDGLLAALQAMSKLQPNDSLLIHTSNHGEHETTESDLRCFPKFDPLGATDFAAALKQLPPFSCLIVMMEQCYCGGFIKPILDNSPADNTSVACSCGEKEESIGYDDFDPFARDWISAMAGASPSGSTVVAAPSPAVPGCVTAAEAFNYANTVHDPNDDPKFCQSGKGGMCVLGGRLLPWPDMPPIVEKALREVWPAPDSLSEEQTLALFTRIKAQQQQMSQTEQHLVEQCASQLMQIILQSPATP